MSTKNRDSIFEPQKREHPNYESLLVIMTHLIIDYRVAHILKQQMNRESLMKCSFCKQQSQIGTKRCSR